MTYQVSGTLTPEYRAYLNTLDPEELRALLTATHPTPAKERA